MSGEELLDKKIKEAEDIFDTLKKGCMGTKRGLFSTTSKSNIENTCKNINDFCRLLREIKHTSKKKWPQLCEKFEMKAKFCNDNKCKIILEREVGKRNVVPFLYTYIEKVGIMKYHFGKNEYLNSLGLNLGNSTNYNVPMTSTEKNQASVKLAVGITKSKSPRFLTSNEELEIYNDIQQKAENARFLRKMNEFCCIAEKNRTTTTSGEGHEKYRFIIKKFLEVMEILTQEKRQDSSSEGTNSSINSIAPSQLSIDSTKSGKKRMSTRERKDKKRKRT